MVSSFEYDLIFFYFSWTNNINDFQFQGLYHREACLGDTIELREPTVRQPYHCYRHNHFFKDSQKTFTDCCDGGHFEFTLVKCNFPYLLNMKHLVKHLYWKMLLENKGYVQGYTIRVLLSLTVFEIWWKMRA